MYKAAVAALYMPLRGQPYAISRARLIGGLERIAYALGLSPRAYAIHPYLLSTLTPFMAASAGRGRKMETNMAMEDAIEAIVRRGNRDKKHRGTGLELHAQAKRHGAARGPPDSIRTQALTDQAEAIEAHGREDEVGREVLQP